jgi:hypothetical protein
MEPIFKTIAILCKLGRNVKELYFLCMATDAQLLIMPSWRKCLRRTATSFVELIKRDLDTVRDREVELRILPQLLMT